MHTGFLMHADPACTRVHKGRNVVVRVLDHQVNVQRRLHMLAQRGHHRRANRNVWDEVPVHYINVQNRRSRGKHGRNLFGEAGKISRQNGWR